MFPCQRSTVSRYAHKDSPNTGWRYRKLPRLRRLHANRGLCGRAHSSHRHESPTTYRHHVCGSGVVALLPPLVGCRRAQCAGVPAIEILSESGYHLHKLTPFARVKGTHITYPPGQPGLQL